MHTLAELLSQSKCVLVPAIQRLRVYFPFLPFFGALVSLACDTFSAKTCLTHFCSSIRNARTTRVRTHVAQREPPYARFTRLSRFFKRLYSTGRKRGRPMSALPQSPQCGPLAFFFKVCKVSL